MTAHHIDGHLCHMNADLGETPTSRTPRPPAPGRYEIRVTGHLAARWAAWFDGMTLTPQHDGSTVIEGPVIDQSALHGLLRKLSDLGLPIVSVRSVAGAAPANRTTDPN